MSEMACASQQRRWADVLEHARGVSPGAYSIIVMNEVNQALYFTGRLLDDMFCYPQVRDDPGVRPRPAMMLHVRSLTVLASMRRSDILFELGRINESEHMAYEALEVFGDRPRTLKRLVHINVLKGRPEAARRFLAVLERSLLHSRWARRCGRQLDADPKLSGVPVVASLRELMVVRDSIGAIADQESMLQGLLETNPRNRMAFEYLMAHYLLTRQLDALVANLHRFDDFDDPRLPRHCEEALVIYLDRPIAES